MEQKRVSSNGGPRGWTVLAFVALFALVPAGAIVTFLGTTKSRNSIQTPSPVTPDRRLLGPPEKRLGALPEPRIVKSPDRRRPLSESGQQGASTSVEVDSPSPSAPSFAQQDADRLLRFDQNARDFDARLAAFERETGQEDEGATAALNERLLTALSPLHPEIEITTTCKASVCVVEMTSPESVGTMIARIAPWLRQHTGAATGDPVDAADENSLRLAFDKTDLPADL